MRRLVAAGLLGSVLCGALAAWKTWGRQATNGDAAIPPVADTAGTVRPADSVGASATAAPSAPWSEGPFRFTELLGESGVDFVHTSGDSDQKPFPAANGSGLAALDFDVDGLADLYFLTGTSLPLDPSRAAPVNRCYRNLGGWRFADVTAVSGLAHNGYSAGVAVGDYDADGFPDVYVTCYGPDRLYRNQGDGTFADASAPAGVADDQWGTGAAFFDSDGDGLLDLYVCNYALWSLETNRYCGDQARGIRLFCNPTTVEPARAALHRNDGDGGFHDALAESGLAGPLGRGQGVIAADLNDDGLIDIYVANDLHPNFLFLNRGGGQFEDVSESSGTAHDFQGKNQAGMGLDVADADRDGRFDLFVTNYEGESNTFYENLGGGLFQDITRSRGLAAESIPWVGWGTAFVDFDRDGWFDVIVTNGHTDDNLRAMGRDSPYEQPPGLWRNDRGRFRFAAKTAGLYFQQSHVGRGLVVADFDNDGDADVAISHQNGPPALLRNDSPTEGRSVRVRLVGTASNREAVGAVLRYGLSTHTLLQQVKGGGSYLSANDQRLWLIIPPEAAEVSVEVRWPSGSLQSWRLATRAADHVLREIPIPAPSKTAAAAP